MRLPGVEPVHRYPLLVPTLREEHHLGAVVYASLERAGIKCQCVRRLSHRLSQESDGRQGFVAW